MTQVRIEWDGTPEFNATLIATWQKKPFSKNQGPAIWVNLNAVTLAESDSGD